MKNRILLVGLFAAIMALSISCNQKKENTSAVTPAIDTAQVKAEIQAIEDHFAETFNTKNADILTYYAEDAISFFPDRSPLVGKANIQQFVLGELVAFQNGATISFETKEVHISNDGNQVVEIGKFVTIDSTKALLNNGSYISLFEKRDGKYVCIRDMSTNEPINP